MEKYKVVVFCGGRGSSSLIRELIKRPNIDVNLLVNAYDDGLSTGALRKLLPGMLGPSDIRKNVSYLIDLFSDSQYALLDFFNYRLPMDLRKEKEDHVINFFKDRISAEDKKRYIPQELSEISRRLEPKLRKELFLYIGRLFDYLRKSKKKYDLSDYSIGNLIYSGVYLSSDMDNNKTINNFRRIFVFNKNAKVFNVTRGENLILVGLKKDGTLLKQEADVVSEQSRVPITDIFLIDNPLDDEQIKLLDSMTTEQKRGFLRGISTKPRVSDQARKVLGEAKIIIYGPGTQHSSLLPSYMTQGVAEAIENNRQAKKILVVNINEDHDIQGFNAHDIFDNLLKYMERSNEYSSIVTHTLYTKTRSKNQIGLRDNKFLDEYRGSKWIMDEFERYSESGIHMGSKLVDTMLAILKGREFHKKPEVDILINMHKRKKGIPDLINELKDLNWTEEFSSINIHLQDSVNQDIKLPPKVKVIYHPDKAVQTRSFKKWLTSPDSKFFATLTGDGIYRMRDVIRYMRFIRDSEFGALFGSRTQDKRQMLTSLNYAYDNSSFWYILSMLASYINTFIYVLKYQKIFSDPLTGFRIYKDESFRNKKRLLRMSRITQQTLASYLLRRGVNIAEVPVYYRTFKDFTDKGWRVKTGIKNTISAILGR